MMVFSFQDFLVSSPGQRILKHTDILWRLVKKRPMNSLKNVFALGPTKPGYVCRGKLQGRLLTDKDLYILFEQFS